MLLYCEKWKCFQDGPCDSEFLHVLDVTIIWHWNSPLRALALSQNSSESDAQDFNCCRKEHHSWWIALIWGLVFAHCQLKNLLWSLLNTGLLFLTLHGRPDGIKFSSFPLLMTTFHWFTNRFRITFQFFSICMDMQFPIYGSEFWMSRIPRPIGIWNSRVFQQCQSLSPITTDMSEKQIYFCV